MLQVQFLKENKELAIKGLEKKRIKDAANIVELVLALDTSRRETQFEADNVLAESNNKAKSIGALMKAGNAAEAETLKAETAALKARSKDLAEKLESLETELYEVLVTLPNLPHESVPQGVSADDNQVAFSWGTVPQLSADALPHWELIKKYDIIDFDLGNKITGAGFPVYKNKGARLQRALINFFLDEAAKAGYIEIQPPILINRDSGFGTGQLPDKDGQMYHAQTDDLFLIPTAEVPITNIYRDVILKESDLPVKNVGYTPCFRREAGSWGAHVRGLNRLHQFDKVEIVQITKPENSYEALEQMSQHVQGLLQKLELPYRVLRLCGGDMSFTSALTFDMEVFSAAQQRWLEVSSVSNFETFQANRLKLRCKSGDQKPYLLHTLNGSALALPRIVAAILENNQREDGIYLPKVLHEYTGFEKI
ncbi:seryl-tRNA synthetase [Flexibacter flexilis DSM 6793]|uniref:Serine--tRNA ligase n=1 Tax=Flexibacter flexilis DSM 6793 TaxID=927664 RepID=A0A1I1DKA7_9BACT|nr:serine--tRNA ligase [Flexibacter flexilis]SFB75395.1 seryl-tRNA synthetase [Flexibacter flexilis DSM 6793]